MDTGITGGTNREQSFMRMDKPITGGFSSRLKQPRTLVGIVLLLAIVTMVSWAIYKYAVPHKIIDSSGVEIKTDTPEGTVTSFYELVSRKRYEPAAALQTTASRKTFTAKAIELQYEQVGMQSASIGKVFNAVFNNRLAVVGIIRVAKFPGNDYETPVVGITVLTDRADKGKWEIVNSLQELPKNEYLPLFEILTKLDKQMMKTNLSGDGFSDNQLKMIKQQITGMEDFHKSQLTEYKNYLKSQDKKKPVKK